MRAVVVYESMYGNTHAIAEAIGRGLSAGGAEVSVLPVGQADPGILAVTDLVVVGGPTHAHGMSREGDREAAAKDATQPGSDLHLDPDAEGEGLREWFQSLPPLDVAAAAFDTRFHMPAMLTGRAAKGISKRLRQRGLYEVAEPESFFVERSNTLVSGEEQRATEWGRTLSAAVVGSAPGS